uniref:Protein kinase domain-containing protein n=1 Tax=Photinus pyralis TaxID=7054 RepID=A0A1Y1KUY5_PHOPY
MIRVDEDDPVGEVELSFPYRDVRIKKGEDPKDYYELINEIGRGKFGTVFKCKEKRTGLDLAAKFIGISKKEDRRNVEREVDIMKCLQHPRLLQIYDAFENGKMMSVILELIEGGELFERVIDEDFVLTEKSCTAFMRQICEGVAFIHKQRILHLDMKPENILCLTKTGNRIKIIDFGLARKYDPDKKLQVLFGTPEFVAPEVVNFDNIGYGTDMWSVGVICYVLLSGLSPFMGHTDVETMANVTIGKYDFDDEAFRNISENAKDFIAKLLLKDMTLRMSAEDCLKHVWLLRRSSPNSSYMEVAKDNLKQFVERWNEHPNSPYVFESSSHIIAPCHYKLQLSESLHSLEGMSPSPCGSLGSSVGSDDGFPHNLTINNDDLLSIPQTDYFRRASDSTGIVKGNDITERLNLADEIRKLTDKLFQLSTMPEFNSDREIKSTTVSSTKVSGKYEVESDRKMHATIPSPAIAINSPNLSQKTHNTKGEFPWRRPKFRVSTSSRDVPLYQTNQTSSFKSSFDSDFSCFMSTKSSLSDESSNSIETTVNGTKDMLLKLLEQWDGPQVPSRPIPRHGSVSNEWSENDNLGQKTISSLNMFFQSRSINKNTHPFMKPNGFK